MRRVRITFWALVVVAIVATGTVSEVLGAPVDGVRIAVAVIAGLVALVAMLLAVRIAIVVARRS